eukprot:CAMPEP_0172177538 /NCGR_PEP_ID=MMETSP1050-20130122/15496_1 /TAXON_ID=233186 /ORGANISM="Cryptomonas curvata, Strain CCAP979/52" /LENGTH=114 /DNA_ID=CAMNT_0012850077 /DNA_START=61 /DNA_END=401 /DNA_ORIENTATION=-
MEAPDLEQSSSRVPTAGLIHLDETRSATFNGGGVTAEVGDGGSGGQRVGGKRRRRPYAPQAPDPDSLQPAGEQVPQEQTIRPELEQENGEEDAEWEAELRRLWYYWMEERVGKT